MRVCLLANPRSGRGRAMRRALSAAEAVRAAGWNANLRRIGVDPPADAGWLDGAAALVVAGGDGSVSRAADACIASGVPIWHLPCGNENLFARAVGSTRDDARLIAALQARRRALVDTAVVESAGSPVRTRVLIMVSLGPDASVIHRLDNGPRRLPGHLAYAGPVLGEAFRPGIPRVRVRVDGKPWIDGQRGLLVIANTRQYALGIDPCPEAGLTTGTLHAAFVPTGSAVGSVWAMMRLRARLDGGLIRRAVGERFEIDAEPAGTTQHDGESLRDHTGPITVRVHPASLPCLIPERGGALQRAHTACVDA